MKSLARFSLRTLMLSLFLTGAIGCGKEPAASTPGEPAAEPAVASNEEHVRFTLSGPELQKTTYVFDPADFTVTNSSNMYLIRAMNTQSKDGTRFITLQLGVFYVPGPGVYNSKEHEVVGSWAYSSEDSGRAFQITEESDVVMELSRTDGWVGATLHGTIEHTNSSSDPNPFYTIESGSFLLRNRR